MSKAPLILTNGQDGKRFKVSLPVNRSYSKVSSELPKTEVFEKRISTVANDSTLSFYQSISKSQITFPSTEFNYSRFPVTPVTPVMQSFVNSPE